MSTQHLIAAYVQELQRAKRMPGAFNQYADYNRLYDVSRKSCDVRAEQLYHYLCERTDAKLVLNAEAAGYQGARFSGIPMTSERILLGWHDIPARMVMQVAGKRTSKAVQGVPAQGFTEPTASTVWRAIRAASISPFDVVFTNTMPFHPIGTNGALSNRAPTARELNATHYLVEHFYSLFPNATVIPLGRVAEDYLKNACVSCMSYVRHPANGGASLFRQGMAQYWPQCITLQWPAAPARKRRKP